MSRLAALGDAVLADGVTVASGVTQVWDVPGGSHGAEVRVVSTVGGARARIACLSRSGGVLVDEATTGDGTGLTVVLPDKTATVVIGCLGRGPAGGAAGWTSTTSLAQVGALTLACPGGWLRVSAPTSSRRRGSNAAFGMVRASEVVSGRRVETTLPATSAVVIVILDLLDQAAADAGDLTVGVDGATLGTPIQVDATPQRILIYEVTSIDDGAASFTVAVLSTAAWQAAGTVGVAGHAAEWAARFSSDIPDDLVGEAAAGPDGAIVVAMTPPPRTDDDREDDA
jgi:hypothetical protein